MAECNCFHSFTDSLYFWKKLVAAEVEMTQKREKVT